uniref:Uncharacterized protein n=1 Tax=Cucumis melo TaxID=3656 RepID=A0A9I9DQ98_CUCME
MANNNDAQQGSKRDYVCRGKEGKINDTMKTPTKKVVNMQCDTWSIQHMVEKMVKEIYSSSQHRLKRDNTGQQQNMTLNPIKSKIETHNMGGKL